MRFALLCLALFTSLAAPAAESVVLHFASAPGFEAVCTWEAGPRSPSESRLEIAWQNSAHAPVEAPAAFAVTLFMPDMGHGSAPTQVRQATDASDRPVTGVYDVSGMYFTMGGEWQVNVTLKTPKPEKQSFTVMVPEELQ